MNYKRGVTCQVTAFQVADPPGDPEAAGRKWLGIATAHVYDPDIVVAGLTPAQAVLTGETMRIVEGRAAADTEAQAMVAALEGLLYQLTAKGYSANTDVKLW